eukprot:9480846-Pyramimonas_sp.AAC.1
MVICVGLCNARMSSAIQGGGHGATSTCYDSLSRVCVYVACVYQAWATYVVQPIWYNRCGAIYVVQEMEF